MSDFSASTGNGCYQFANLMAIRPICYNPSGALSAFPKKLPCALKLSKTQYIDAPYIFFFTKEIFYDIVATCLTVHQKR